ncbi:MAG TPA: DUF4347 domain-containing protein, partial [Desulfomicrobiaceae bacterium]|nr:DUF4347 domain-containing protein [Desulfomicrobiaceae bacterium]
MSFFKKFFTARTASHETNLPKKSLKATPMLLALEQRYLYDASGVAAGLAVLADHAVQDAPEVDVHDIDVQPEFSPESFVADLVPPAIEPPAESGTELIIVDPSVPDHEQLAQSISGTAKVVVLDPTMDGVTQIRDILAESGTLSAVHILSHGSADTIHLGDTVLSSSTLSEHTDTLRQWSDNLTDNADILFYGCNVAESEAGRTMLSDVAELTGADVAASVDATGAAALGGDWDLEMEAGDVADWGVTGELAESGYEGVLGDISVSDLADQTISEGGSFDFSDIVSASEGDGDTDMIVEV